MFDEHGGRQVRTRTLVDTNKDPCSTNKGPGWVGRRPLFDEQGLLTGRSNSLVADDRCPCSTCNGPGYRGRTTLLWITETLVRRTIALDASVKHPAGKRSEAGAHGMNWTDAEPPFLAPSAPPHRRGRADVGRCGARGRHAPVVPHLETHEVQALANKNGKIDIPVFRKRATCGRLFG